MSVFTTPLSPLSHPWNTIPAQNEVFSSLPKRYDFEAKHLSLPTGEGVQQNIQQIQMVLQNFCSGISNDIQENRNNIKYILNDMEKSITANKENIQLIKNIASKAPLVLIQKEAVHCSPVNIMAALFLAIFIISLFATVMAILGLTGVLSNVSIFFGSVNLVWAASSCAAVGIISLIAFVCLSVYGFLHKEISTIVTEKKIENSLSTPSNINTVQP